MATTSATIITGDRDPDCLEDELDLFCTDDDKNIIKLNKVDGTDSIVSATESVVDETEYEDDDDVNIIINNGLMSDNYTNFMNDFIREDLELNIEVKKLILDNIEQYNKQQYGKAIITLYAQDTVIPVTEDAIISSRLTNHVWGTECPYKKFNLKNHECFDYMLNKYRRTMNEISISCNDGSDPDSYEAFFAAIYENMSKPINTVDRRTASRCSENNRTARNFHFFKRFAIIVLKNGTFVDAAIHGYYSSVTDVLKRYKPKRVYCAGNENDTIDAFLKFKHQPFYSELNGKNLHYIGNSLIRNQTSVMFCPQNLKFCAFCRAIDTVLTYYANMKQYRIVPFMRDGLNSTITTNEDTTSRTVQRRRQQQRYKNRNAGLSIPYISQIVENLHSPRYIPFRVLNYKNRMRCEKNKRFRHNGTIDVGSKNIYNNVSR